MSRDRHGNPMYGAVHKAARKRFARRMAAGEVFYCWRPTCPTPNEPLDPRSWDLGHVEGAEEIARFGLRWPEHRKCNRATLTHAKGEVVYAVRVDAERPPRFGGLPDPDPGNTVERWSRHWSGSEFNPRCPACRERGSACDVARERNDAA
jgi:hypothetical protein